MHMNITQSFYDNLAPQYDKLFEDWNSATDEQADILERICCSKTAALAAAPAFSTVLAVSELRLWDWQNIIIRLPLRILAP